jgi:hypothetical protein
MGLLNRGICADPAQQDFGMIMLAMNTLYRFGDPEIPDLGLNSPGTMFSRLSG